METLSACSALPDYAGRKVSRFHYANVVVGKAKRRMQLHVWHMAPDAVAGLPGIAVSGGAAVTGEALLVVKGGLVSNGILMRGMAGCASQPARPEAAAFHQPQRLKTHVLELRVINRRLDPVAISTEADLLGCRQLSGI